MRLMTTSQFVTFGTTLFVSVRELVGRSHFCRSSIQFLPAILPFGQNSTNRPAIDNIPSSVEFFQTSTSVIIWKCLNHNFCLGSSPIFQFPTNILFVFAKFKCFVCQSRNGPIDLERPFGSINRRCLVHCGVSRVASDFFRIMSVAQEFVAQFFHIVDPPPDFLPHTYVFSSQWQWFAQTTTANPNREFAIFCSSLISPHGTFVVIEKKRFCWNRTTRSDNKREGHQHQAICLSKHPGDQKVLASTPCNKKHTQPNLRQGHQVPRYTWTAKPKIQARYWGIGKVQGMGPQHTLKGKTKHQNSSRWIVGRVVRHVTLVFSEAHAVFDLEVVFWPVMVVCSQFVFCSLKCWIFFVSSLCALSLFLERILFFQYESRACKKKGTMRRYNCTTNWADPTPKVWDLLTQGSCFESTRFRDLWVTHIRIWKPRVIDAHFAQPGAKSWATVASIIRSLLLRNWSGIDRRRRSCFEGHSPWGRATTWDQQTAPIFCIKTQRAVQPAIIHNADSKTTEATETWCSGWQSVNDRHVNRLTG